MEQIKIALYLIGTDTYMDYLLPLDRPLCEFLEEIAAQAERTDDALCFDRTQPWMLCDLDRHLLLDPQKSLAELGICNGARLSLC